VIRVCLISRNILRKRRWYIGKAALVLLFASVKDQGHPGSYAASGVASSLWAVHELDPGWAARGSEREDGAVNQREPRGKAKTRSSSHRHLETGRVHMWTHSLPLNPTWVKGAQEGPADPSHYHPSHPQTRGHRAKIKIQDSLIICIITITNKLGGGRLHASNKQQDIDGAERPE
jgi:hypothetical protein